MLINNDDKLQRLCKYYLDCLSLDDNNGIKIAANGANGNDYIEHTQIKFGEHKSTDIAKIIGRLNDKPQNASLHFGYPILIEKRGNKFDVIPVLLFEAEKIDYETIYIQSTPRLNINLIKKYSNSNGNAYIYELINLEKELGLDEHKNSFNLDKLIKKLCNIKGHWNWVESIYPNILSTGTPLSSIKNEGIYNRAIVLISEKSPFVIGLEKELLYLSEIKPEDYRNTALYDWIHGWEEEQTKEINDEIIEVLPLNNNQLKALQIALTNRLTVVSGPPGTGKSQAIINLLINIAIKDKSALFSSKNNKAVDIVEDRINELGNDLGFLNIKKPDKLNDYIHKLHSVTPDENKLKMYKNNLVLYSKKNNQLKDLLNKKREVINLLKEIENIEILLSSFNKCFINKIIKFFKTIKYKKLLNSLNCCKRIEESDEKYFEIRKELIEIAKIIWSKWLPKKLYLNNNGEEISDLYTELKYSQNINNNILAQYLPCWAVTSLAARRVPLNAGLFDLLIIDEASQCDIASALPLLYRAKNVVIIGDKQQLSHITGLSIQQDINLLTKYKIRKAWSYKAISLFDLAHSRKYKKTITLLDHYRSHEDIITFPNKLFYDEELNIATNYKGLNIPKSYKAGITWKQIKGYVTTPKDGSSINDLEAKKILEILNELIFQDCFSGSIGVTSPFRAQINYINNLIAKNSNLNQSLIHKNQFHINTINGFQGDEKDIILFSPVIAANISDGSYKFLKDTGNLFNVAITRAKALHITVGDRDYCKKCGIDYLEKFANYTIEIENRKTAQPINIKDLTCKYPTNLVNMELVSKYEIEFYEALYKADIFTNPQFHEDKYYLDLALFDGDRKLDIEVDGEQHRDWDGGYCYKDQLRNERLYSLEWEVMRFWTCQIRNNIDWCVEQVLKWKNDIKS